LSDDEQALVQRIKILGEDLHQEIGKIPVLEGGVRESNLARMKVEEAVMWAVKAITG
jgi:hypothetical protein